jgi:CheY-like chemotaxis protein
MKPRILVVEDNRASRELLCDWLEVEGYAVESATRLEEAIGVVEANPPDAVLLDVQLGPDDGLALVQWMRGRANLQHIPVIAVTARAMLADQERILRAGCNAALAKPVDFRLLRERLQRWLGHVPRSPATR